MEKNTFKLSQMLEISSDKAQKLLDLISLSDMAALTTAINANDSKTVASIYSKYKNTLDSNASPTEVIAFYNDLTHGQNMAADEALVNTADHFGITGEEAQQAITPKAANESKTFIPDVQVAKAFENVQEMLEGGASRHLITELNTWQRRMFYGLIPPVVAKVIQDTIDMTPIAVMQKHAKEMGYGEPAIKESELSLAEMIEKIIERTLNKLKNAEKIDEEPEVCTMDMGTIEAKPSEEVDPKTKELIQSIVLRRF